VHEAGAEATQGRLRDLWAPAFRRDTLALWLAFAAGLFSVYAVGSWLPTVLSSAGLPLASAIRGSVAFNLGGVFGSLLVAWAIMRRGSRAVLLATVAVGIAAGIALALLPASTTTFVPLLAAIAVLGASLNGSATGLYAVAAHVYPTALRASGVGWALGVSRFAAVLSAFAGSAVLALGSGTAPFFVVLALVLALMFVGVALVRRHVPR
jgi:AAHS family 4-hydroxybenzoate transporter-like MFS transporter